jgi:hypothetical protein
LSVETLTFLFTDIEGSTVLLRRLGEGVYAHVVADQAFLDRTGESWQEPEASYRQDSLTTVRAALGAEQFDRAYAQGKSLGLDQALDLALGLTRSA